MNIDLTELAALAEKIGTVFEFHGLRYHLTGGVIASYYGEVRNTQDVDIVVEMDACKDRQALFQDLNKEFYVDQSAFDEAIRMKFMFVLSPRHGLHAAGRHLYRFCVTLSF